MLRAEIRGILFVTGLGLVALLAFAHIPARPPGLPVLQSLQFHLAALLLAVCVLLAAFGGWRRALIAVLLGAVLVGLTAWDLYERDKQRLAVAADRSVELIHFNINGDNLDNGMAIARMLANSEAGLAVVLEARPLAAHLAELSAAFPYRVGCNDADACDLTLFSRYPLSDIRIESLSRFSTNRVIIATADVDGRPLTVAAVHLAKAYFDDIPHNETERLADLLKTVTTPLVVTGDFNAAPWSYNLQHLQDWAGLLPPPAYPATWPPQLDWAGVPIDSAYVRDSAITAISALQDPFGSNHRALRVTVALPAR